MNERIPVAVPSHEVHYIELIIKMNVVGIDIDCSKRLLLAGI